MQRHIFALLGGMMLTQSLNQKNQLLGFEPTGGSHDVLLDSCRRLLHQFAYCCATVEDSGTSAAGQFINCIRVDPELKVRQARQVGRKAKSILERISDIDLADIHLELQEQEQHVLPGTALEN